MWYSAARGQQRGADWTLATALLHLPERLNAATAELVRELRDVQRHTAAEPGIRAVVLTGAGRAFCAGADLGTMSSASSNAELPRWRVDPGEMLELMEVTELHRMPKVPIAAIHGACAGAGLAFSASCDLRYAARSARFATGLPARQACALPPTTAQPTAARSRRASICSRVRPSSRRISSVC